MIEVGDHVTIGKGSTTWVAESVEPGVWAWLRSGVTGIHRYEPFSRLTLFKKGNV